MSDLWSLDVYNSLLVFSLLNILDIITTYNVVSKYGVEHEANWFARWIFRRLGIAGAFILKYLGMGLVILFGALTNSLTSSIWIDNILLSAVVGWNSYANYKYSQNQSS
jgi:hypothetical protein